VIVRRLFSYALHRYSIYCLGGFRWILCRLNCLNCKLVLRPGAPAANTSGNQCRTNSGARRWKCSGVTLFARSPGPEGRPVKIEEEAPGQALSAQGRRAEEGADADRPHTPRRAKPKVDILHTCAGGGFASTGFLQAAGRGRIAGRLFISAHFHALPPPTRTR
jgi:hypothetical protein